MERILYRILCQHTGHVPPDIVLTRLNIGIESTRLQRVTLGGQVGLVCHEQHVLTHRIVSNQVAPLIHGQQRLWIGDVEHDHDTMNLVTVKNGGQR